MAWPWIVLPPAQTPTTERVDDTLTVVWRRKTLDLEREVATFDGGVQITYGLTTVHADRLELHLAEEERFGVAEGNVRLVDPDGTIDARNLKFDWRQGTGSASNVLVRALDVVISAESMSIAPDRWELIRASGVPCEGTRPPVSLSSPKVVIEPGRKARITRPRLSIYGTTLPALPSATLTLDRRIVGFTAPSISDRRGQGLGVNWKSGFLLDDQTGLTASILSFPRSYPSFNLEVARSAVPPTASTGLISPRSDLQERFRGGYLNNISVESPDSERKNLGAVRDTLAIGSYWGVDPTSRPQSATLNKPIELTYERGGTALGIVGTVQLRAQHVREVRGEAVTRGSLSLSASPPHLELARNLAGIVRFDGYAATSGRNSYGWGYAQVGVVATPLPGVRLGAGYYDSVQGGHPHFESDRLLSPRGWLFRADLEWGPRALSYLAKWDSRTGAFWDREYQVSQVMDCFEGYILFRQEPSEYRFGLRLRIDRFIEALQRRDLKRSNE